jgi:protein phosphatase
MLLTSAALTHVGLVRPENEDRLLRDDELALYAVADGIGGLPGGAEAAQLAIDSLLRSARTARESATPPNLISAFREANQEVLALGRRLAPETGLGTTLTASFVRDDAIHLASVGDSRCYLLRDGRLRLLTIDDTVEQEILMRRARGENIQLEDRYRNALTRCIGQPMPLDVQVSVHALQPGDRVLLCSDGISRLVSDQTIERRLRQDGTPALVLADLVRDALALGGHDNITGVLLEFDPS